MADDISPNAVPFEEIIGIAPTSPGLLTPQQAMAIASRESFVVGPPYSIGVYSAAGDLCKLEVTRMIGGVPRSQSMGIDRRRSESAFGEACRKTWLMLLEEHEREQEVLRP